VLLSPDHHGDNLDDAGRALLPSAGIVLTNHHYRGQLRHPSGSYGGRHPGPAWTAAGRAIAGDVVGFALGWEGQEHGVLWISGDTVLYDGIRQVAKRLTVETAVLHLGAVQFGIIGPVRYTMTAREAVAICNLLRPRTVLPVHYEGWDHFREGRQTIEAAFAGAPDEVRSTLRWLPLGQAVSL
jgi:L-ascorbate metabolism protein UlaG (beta-lactamase superfamily)